jgi:hypothetical protein
VRARALTTGLRHLLRPLPVAGPDPVSRPVMGSRAAASESRLGIAWLAAVALAFTLAVLAFTPLRASLGWDETVYASQISRHLAVLWSAERARGMPLLIAPVTLLTSSATVLRVYLTVLAGLGLFAALACWRRLRADRVLALAGLIFGGLWIVESQASQVYPNFWIALGALAGLGLFLRAVTRTGKRGCIVLLGVAAAFTSLMRPPDALALFCPLLLAAAVTVLTGRADWRAQLTRVTGPVLAILAGLAIGIGDWVVEAHQYFGGALHRLKLQSAAVGGTRFAPVSSLRILSGGRASSVPGFPTLAGWSDPWLLLWWLVFGIVALTGVYAIWRAEGWLPALAPAFCAACEYLLYTFPARDAIRYLQPAWALLAISAADGLAFLLTRPRVQLRPVAVVLVAAFLVAELGTQHAVLTGQSAALRAKGADTDKVAGVLRHAGVTPPCVTTSVARPAFAAVAEPAAYALGCGYKWTMSSQVRAHGSRVLVFVLGRAAPFAYAAGWPSRALPGGVTAYIEPAGS